MIGGGVAQQASLLPRVRVEVARLLNDDVQARAITHELDRCIVAPGLGGRSGVLGALALVASTRAQ